MTDGETPRPRRGLAARVLTIAVTGALGLAALVLGLSRFAGNRLLSAAEQAHFQALTRWAAERDADLAELNALRESGYFLPPAGARDAAPILTSVAPPFLVAATSPALEPALEAYVVQQVGPAPRHVVPQALRDSLDAWGKEYLAHAADVVPATLDLGWLHALLECDHLGSAEAAVLEGVPAQELAGVSVFEIGLDRQHALPDFAKLRLLQGLRAKDLPSALREVSHLARLLVSSEEEASAVSGLGLLWLEELALAWLDAHGTPVAQAVCGGTLPAAAGDCVPRREALQKLSRLLLGLPLSPWMEVDDLRLLALNAPRPLLCAGLAEAAKVYGTLRPTFEQDYLEYEAWLTSELGSAQCRLPGVLRAWEARSAKSLGEDAYLRVFSEQRGTTGGFPGEALVLEISPNLRRGLRESLLALAADHGLKQPAESGN